MACGDDNQISVLTEQSAPDDIHSGRDGRLVRKNQFDLVRRSGTTVAGLYCVVNVLKTPPDGASRAAFSISRRYSKLAVERNRARRLFREVYRRMSSELAGFWVVFIPRHKMKTAKMGDVLDDARGCFGRILADWANG